MQVFDTPDKINLYVAVVLKSALELYAKTGIKVNRAYTPTNMLRKAGEITGKQFRPRDYQAAIQALEEFIHS